MTPTHLIAFDPGARTGWAVARIEDATIITSGIARGKTAQLYRAELMIARLGLVTLPGSYALIIEKAFTGRGGKFAGAGLSLARKVGRIETVFHEAPARDVPPGSWKVGVGIPGNLGGREAAVEYIRVAAELLGCDESEFAATGDRAAAVCLASYAARRISKGMPLAMDEDERKQRNRDRAKIRRDAKKAPGQVGDLPFSSP